ncbi:MAG: hypothetical protein Q9191_000622 [Dirinaria sp. TL-2023a]
MCPAISQEWLNAEPAAPQRSSAGPLHQIKASKRETNIITILMLCKERENESTAYPSTPLPFPTYECHPHSRPSWMLRKAISHLRMIHWLAAVQQLGLFMLREENQGIVSLATVVRHTHLMESARHPESEIIAGALDKGKSDDCATGYGSGGESLPRIACDTTMTDLDKILVIAPNFLQKPGDDRFVQIVPWDIIVSPVGIWVDSLRHCCVSTGQSPVTLVQARNLQRGMRTRVVIEQD